MFQNGNLFGNFYVKINNIFFPIDISSCPIDCMR